MGEGNKQESDESRVDVEASEWVVRNDSGLSASEQDAFFQWLADSPAHGEAFAKYRRSWLRSKLLANRHPEVEEHDFDALFEPQGQIAWKRWVVGAMAVAACMMLALGISFYAASSDVDAETFHLVADAYRYEVLSDGSGLDLDAGTELTVRYTPEERQIEVFKGQAFFTVAKNRDRPFVVVVGDNKLRAVGTAFSVTLGAEGDVELLVTEGRVRWESNAPEGLETTGYGVSPYSNPEVGAGQRSVLASGGDLRESITLADVTPSESASLLSWRHQLLDFSSVPLSEAISEFNRRNTVQILVPDEDLRDEPIFATVQSDDVEHFVQLLELALGVVPDRSEPGKITLRHD